METLNNNHLLSMTTYSEMSNNGETNTLAILRTYLSLLQQGKILVKFHGTTYIHPHISD